MRLRGTTVLFSILLFLAPAPRAELLINEVLSLNLLNIADEDGDYSDWIELVNSGPDTVSLANYGLSDSEGEPFKWVFAGGTMRRGHFVPDYEGTVVCLANFEAPILDVPFESSTKTSELLFVANEKAIPEVGTPVTLILKATGEMVKGKKLV